MKLAPYERQMLVCRECRSSDHLERDSLCVWCRQCGPSVAVDMMVGMRPILASEPKP